MSDDPEYRDAAPQSGPPDALHESDRAMLSAVSHRQRDTTPLSLDQERLLESWVAGRLPSKLADRAAELTKSNKLAAEYVLERRLTAAADEGPDVPSALSARILRASRPAPLGRLSLFNLARSMFNAWKWPGMGVAVAASIAFIVVFGFLIPSNQGGFQFARIPWHLRPEQTFQIAMVNINDRNALLDEPRYRTRGRRQSSPNLDGPAAQTPVIGEIYDLEVPTTLLRHAINSAPYDNQYSEHSQLMSSLRVQEQSIDSRALILIDSSLAEGISEKTKRSSTSVRVYNLDNAAASAIRSKIPKLPVIAHAILLTLR